MGKSTPISFSLSRFLRKRTETNYAAAGESSSFHSEQRYDTNSGDNSRSAVDALEAEELVYAEKISRLMNSLETVRTNKEHGKQFRTIIASLKKLQSIPKVNSLFENSELCPKRLERSSGMKWVKERGGIKDLGGTSLALTCVPRVWLHETGLQPVSWRLYRISGDIRQRSLQRADA